MGRGNRILAVNQSAEEITGYGKEELEATMKWTDLVLSEDRDPVKNLIRILKAGSPDRQEVLVCRLVDRRGMLRFLNLSGHHHRDSALAILWMFDITEHMESKKRLQVAREKAEESDRLKSAFLGNLSHEIRTPMNAIGGFASLLHTEGLPEEKRRMYLAQIVNGSNDLLYLIEKTILLSRIDLGQLKINRRQFFVNQALNELQKKYRNILDKSGKEDIQLIVETGRQEEDFVVQADRLRVIEVMNYLLENAVKFTSGGSITFGYAYLDEESENGNDSLLFYVKDSGCGIPRDQTGIIFDRFVKLVDQNDTVLRGAGLGLAISRDLVRLMNGEIWVESVPEQGSKFFFTLPLQFSRVQEAGMESPRGKEEFKDWSEFSILIAEDIESNYIYIKELLLPTGINILRARDGLEAVELFEKHGASVVLMDILMPGLDGYEATTRIRESAPDIPVVAQTAFTFEGEMQNGLYAGCFSDYIMKPFTGDMLLASLKKYLLS